MKKKVEEIKKLLEEAKNLRYKSWDALTEEQQNAFRIWYDSIDPLFNPEKFWKPELINKYCDCLIDKALSLLDEKDANLLNSRKLIRIWLVWEWKKVEEKGDATFVFPRLAEVCTTKEEAETRKKVMLNAEVMPIPKDLIHIEIEETFANHPFAFQELQAIRSEQAHKRKKLLNAGMEADKK